MVKNLFTQDVNREIETVVKADDTRNVDQEIREYVITNEISRKIVDLFSDYGRVSKINGVWIHGFFGSGKSHLLKMLSFVFGGRQLSDGTTAAQIFAQKTQDEFLKADINRVAQIPAESILFNIDQQATISNNEAQNSVMLVFYKVFYDHLGFYGTQPHIAEFEWWLQFSKNIYHEFKKEFEIVAGKEWIHARRDFFDPDVIDAASATLGKLTNREESDFETILEDLEKRLSLSIEHLATRVAEYIKTKPKGFHLNFFIDEVGQFIAGDINQMLNLQTIAESLATATDNKSWLFVTAQSAIENLGDDIKKSQDYARILGRFKLAINLTSANVDEVIEKRLLEKKKEQVPILKNMYNEHKSLINALISSSDKGMPIIAYKDEDDFVLKYPFLYYQFSLFQSCRISLAEHDVFQGKHASVGERNMLGVFQSVLKEVENNALLTLPSFDKMYKGIENDLRAEFVTSINNAQSNLQDDYALKVFKTLFLLKYFKQFLATKENIAMLLIDNVNINIQKHQERVNRALALLEHHSYIERNGELYEFLTNKEKDIETEIKNTRIEESDVNKMMKELFFDETLGRSRIRYEDNKQDYDYTQKLDDGIFGREHELSVEIFTPNYAGIESLDTLKSQTMGLSVLRLVTQPNPEFVDDVRMYLKVQRYSALNQQNANNNEIRSIIYQKLSDNTRRRESLRSRANTILGSSKAFVNGTQLDVLPKASGQSFVTECFQHLVKIVYDNLRMLGTNSYTQDTFKRITQGYSVPGLFDDGDASVSEAETHLLNYVERRRNQHDRTSVYDLKLHFSKRPYGWHENAVFSILAKLYKKNKVEINIGENPLDDNQFIDALLNSSQHSRAFVVAQTVFTATQIKNIKNLYRELFDRNTSFNDAKDIGLDFKEKLKELTNDVANIMTQTTDYPFVSELKSFHDSLRHWNTKNYKEIIETTQALEDALLDIKEDHYDPIKAFINGEQARVYRNISETVNRNTANISFVDGDEFSKLKEFMTNPKPYLGTALQQAEELRKKLQTKVLEMIEGERNKAHNAYTKDLEMLKEHDELKSLNSSSFDNVLKPINQKIADIKEQRYIGNLRSDLALLPSLVETALNSAVALNAKANEVYETVKNEQTAQDINSEPVVAIKYVNKHNVHVPFDKSELSTEEDVRQYVESLQKVFLKQIKENKKIRL